MDARTEALAKFRAETDRLQRSSIFTHGVKGVDKSEERLARFIAGQMELAELLLNLTAGRDVSPDEMVEMANAFQDHGKMLEQQSLRQAAVYLSLRAMFRDLLDATRKEPALAAA